jgi:hypothetical protein
MHPSRVYPSAPESFAWLLLRPSILRGRTSVPDTPYEDVFASKHPEDLEAYTVQLKKPFFAFPAISHGDFFLSQTPVIVRCRTSASLYLTRACMRVCVCGLV